MTQIKEQAQPFIKNSQDPQLLATNQQQNPVQCKSQILNKLPVHPIIFIALNILSFVVQFNYSIQNAIITMLMISFGTPSIIDSLVWIIPNIVSILIRPYVIRFVHKAHKAHKIRSQAFLINLFLLLGAIGAIIVAQSCYLNQSKKSFSILRILVCTVGWTFTGMSFELCGFFEQKFKQSLQQQFYIVKENQNTSQPIKEINFENIEKNQTLQNNFSFLGALAGYIFVILIFAFPLKNISKMKSFFQQSGLAYTVAGFLTLVSTIVFYLILNFSRIPKQDPQLKPKQIPFKISYSPNYYLPGLSQMKYMSSRAITMLAIHFIMTFVMDVMFIYTTMWTAGSIQASQMKQSESNFYGMKNGVFFLVVYTVFYYGNILPQINSKLTSFVFISFATAGIFLFSFWFYHTYVFLFLTISLVWLYKTYQDHIWGIFEQQEEQIKVSKQVVQRIQKVAVLNVLPFVVMILLGRDDIQDCLIWCAVLLIVVGLLSISFNRKKIQAGQGQKQKKQ